MHESIRRFAEDPARYVSAPLAGRILDERFVLTFGPTRHTVVTSVDVDPERLVALVEEIRDLVRPDRREVAWTIGPSCRPSDLSDRLRSLGLVAATAPFEPRTSAMALAEPPEIGSTDGVEVHVVASLADYRTSEEVMAIGSGFSDDDRAAMAATVDERYPAFLRRPEFLRYVALLDGKPVATASACACDAGLFLGGGATLPGARGRGAYRALVRARWDEAVRRGTPALAIHAGEMSRPILERLGFEPVCELSVLHDPATVTPEPVP